MSLALEQRLPKTESSDMHVCPICSNCQTPASSCLLPMCGTSLMHKFYIIHRFLQGWSTKILSRLTDLRNCFFFFLLYMHEIKRRHFFYHCSRGLSLASRWSSLPSISNLIFCLSSGYILFYLLPFSFPSPHTFLLTHDLLLTL